LKYYPDGSKQITDCCKIKLDIKEFNILLQLLSTSRVELFVEGLERDLKCSVSLQNNSATWADRV
jgi:hypothetical protein